MEEEDKARNERKNGQERRKRFGGMGVWVFILRRGTQLFHGCRLGCRWKQRQDATPLLRPPSLEMAHAHLLYHEFATRTILPAIYSLFLAITVILLSRPRREMLVLFLAVEHASWRVELKTVDCKWYGRVAHVFCQMNHFKRIDGVEGSEYLRFLDVDWKNWRNRKREKFLYNW